MTGCNPSDGDERVRVMFVNTRSALGADVAVHLALIANFDPGLVDVFVVTNRHSVDVDATIQHLSGMPGDRVIAMDLGHEVSQAGRGRVGRLAGFFGNIGSLGSLIRLAALVRKHRIDILHSTDRPRDALFGTVLARMTGRRNVVHAHISWNDHFGRAARWALDNCTAVFAVSEFSRRSFEQAGVPAAKLHTVHNATDASRFDPDRVPRGALRDSLGLSSDAPLIGIVARVMLWKGHLELIDALAKVRDAVPTVQLAIVGEEDLLAIQGEGRFAEQVRSRIAALDLNGNVHWTGWHDDIPSVMRDLDVLAMPSWEEPFGLALTEAMAMETPVVGFASGSLPEIITTEVEGLLAPPRETDALAAAIVRLLQDRDLRERMGRRGRERVLSVFNPRRQADQVTEIYRSLIGRTV